jgi:hypothetical protein
MDISLYSGMKFLCHGRNEAKAVEIVPQPETIKIVLYEGYRKYGHTERTDRIYDTPQ